MRREEKRGRGFIRHGCYAASTNYSGFGKNDNDEAILGKTKGGCFVVLYLEWVVGPFSAAERRQVVLPCRRHGLARYLGRYVDRSAH